MKFNSKSQKTIFSVLEKDFTTTSQKINRFYDILRNLRYEGKARLTKNMSELIKLTAYFKKKLDGHMREEEKTIFPFLKTHIPRLEPMVYLLLSEHEDFRHGLKRLRKVLDLYKKQRSAGHDLIHEIYGQGTYLVCLLRSHMQVENQNLYKAVDEELHANERRKLMKLIMGAERGKMKKP